MRKVLYLFIAVLLSCVMQDRSIAASSIEARLSDEEVIKTHNFKQAIILISGMLKQPADVVIEVYGPPATYRLWKKEKKFGFWVNSKNIVISSIFSYHMLASSNTNNHQIVSLLESLKADFAEYMHDIILHSNNDSLDPIDAQLAFQKLQYNNGFFIKKVCDISMRGNEFSSSIHLPSTALPGKYMVKIYMVKDGKISEVKYLTFSVYQDRLYSELDTLASQKPLLYALAAVLIAIAISITISLLFKNL